MAYPDILEPSRMGKSPDSPGEKPGPGDLDHSDGNSGSENGGSAIGGGEPGHFPEHKPAAPKPEPKPAPAPNAAPKTGVHTPDPNGDPNSKNRIRTEPHKTNEEIAQEMAKIEAANRLRVPLKKVDPGVKASAAAVAGAAGKYADVLLRSGGMASAMATAVTLKAIEMHERARNDDAIRHNRRAPIRAGATLRAARTVKIDNYRP